MIPIPVLTLAFVFLMTAVRKIGTFRFKLWQIMALGAAFVLMTGAIPPLEAVRAIDLNVMAYLFGVFMTGQALEESGFLSHLAYTIFRKAQSADALLLSLLFGTGIFSALLMNDTLAIIGTPVILLLSERHGISARVFLLALAFGVTTGSVLSPVGNPQNLLIALSSGMPNSFLTFFYHLAIPTFLSLLACYGMLKLFYPADFHKRKLLHDQPPKLRDPHLAVISKICLGLLAGLIGGKIIFAFLGKAGISLPAIALISALPVMASPRRFEILRKIDWETLAFFAAMFVLMQSVWDTGFFQSLFEKLKINPANPDTALGIGLVLSQFISNVPLAALYLPYLKNTASPETYLALAAGSTLAGNMLILGAASNVIILQNSEKRGGPSISFWEFARIGIPLTLIQAVIYRFFLNL